MNTQVKWNTDKPKFEDVEGKSVVVKINTAFPKKTALHFYSEVGRSDYLDFYNWDRFIAYAILSDEQEYCEYSLTMHKVYNPSCNPEMNIDGEKGYKFCPHCGNPIKIIDELKPLPLMGIEPEIFENAVADGIYYLFYHWQGEGAAIDSQGYKTKRETIESWNSLVEKLTGEK